MSDEGRKRKSFKRGSFKRTQSFAEPSGVGCDHNNAKNFANFRDKRLYLPDTPTKEPYVVHAGNTVSESYRMQGVLFDDFKVVWNYSPHDYYYLDKSGNYLLVLHRCHRNNKDHITIYLKPSTKDAATGSVQQFACVPLGFSAKWWLVSPCKHYYAVAGNPYGKDGLELAVFKIEYYDDELALKKITKIDCSEGPCDKSDVEILAWAIHCDIFVAFTLRMVREQNTIQMYICKIEDEKISCTRTFDLHERVMLFGEITDVCLRKGQSVVFTTNAFQVFRYDLNTNELSNALTLGSLKLIEGTKNSNKRIILFIGKVDWHTGKVGNLKEVYYICSVAGDLFEVIVDDENKLKENSFWELSKIDKLNENLKVIGFSIDKHSSRGCVLFGNGNVLCIDMCDPFHSHKIIFVNSDLKYNHPRMFVNWRTSEVVVYNDEKFCSQLIPYEEFNLKHIARMAVLAMNSDERLGKLDIPKRLTKFLQFRIERHRRKSIVDENHKSTRQYGSDYDHQDQKLNTNI